MSFEVKYDKDRNPIIDPAIKQQALTETPAEQPEPVQELAAEEPQVAEQVVEEAAQPVEEPKKEPAVQDSFRQLRLKAEQAERERDELLRMLKERELQTQAQTKPLEPEEDNEIHVGSDDLVEGKHLTKVGRQIKQLKEEINQYKKQSADVATEVKLKTLYPDFEKIVSKENIESLRHQFPEIANTINTSTGDLYSKAVSAYTMIKKLGIHQEPVIDTFKEDKERAQVNAAKPRPLASVSPLKGDNALSNANAFAKGLTKDLQEQLRREMEEARRAM
jgi:hypothetical protein